MMGKGVGRKRSVGARALALSSAAVLLLAAPACGDEPDGPAAQGGPGSQNDDDDACDPAQGEGCLDAGSSDAGGNGEVTGMDCPESEPTSGQACTQAAGVPCVYGEHADCRMIWLCRKAKWMPATFPRACPAEGASGICPEAAAHGSPCNPGDPQCVYEDGRACRCAAGPTDCDCSTEAAESAYRWSCGPQSPCPPTPLVDTPCGTPGTTCEYPTEFCLEDASDPAWHTPHVTTCEDGTWDVAFSPKRCNPM